LRRLRRLRRLYRIRRHRAMAVAGAITIKLRRKLR
jgi:hypothetical protein